MRVLVLTQGYPRHADDHHATFIRDHARALAAAGATVTVLCPSGPGLLGEEVDGEARVVRFRYAPSRWETLAYSGAMHRRARGWRALLVPALFLGFLVAALRSARDADVVHGHWWIPSGVVAVVVGRLVGLPSVVHLHGTDVALARGPLRWVARAVLRGASAVLAVSSELAAWAGPRARVAPMPLPAWIPAPTSPPADGTLLAVGRLVPEKGFDVFVRACAAAGVKATIVGDGDQREPLQHLIGETGASVELAGALSGAELADHYRRARLVVVPSRREGFGLVAAEAAAAGRAVVASDVGGLPDIVRPDVNGVLVPPDDVAALAAAISSIDVELGANGPTMVRSLSPEAVGQRDLATYAALVAPKALGRPLARVVAGVLAIAAIFFCVLTLSERWSDAQGEELYWSWPPVAFAVLAVASADLLMAWAWGWLLRRLGEPVGWRVAMRVWWTGQLGRWLPTGLGAVPARMAAAAAAQMRGRLVVRSTAAEPAAAVAACLLLAALLLPGPLLAMALVVVGSAAAYTWSARRALVGFVGLQTIQTVVRALGFWILLGISTDGRPPLVITVGAIGLAYGLGFLAVFSPGGIGVREAVLAAALSAHVSPQSVAAAAVAWRFLEVAVEVPLTLWSRTLRPARPSPGTLEPTAR